MKKEDILGSVHVASPCKASWDNMEGDYRVRHCAACQHKVYNLSEMTRTEAETLVAGTEGRLCVRFYRRPDGTMLTQDCPVGMMAVRKKMATALACAATLFISLCAYAASFGRQKPVYPAGTAGKLNAYEKARKVETLRIVLDKINPPPTQYTTGMIAAPVTNTPVAPMTHTPTPVQGDIAPSMRIEVGKIAVRTKTNPAPTQGKE